MSVRRTGLSALARRLCGVVAIGLAAPVASAGIYQAGSWRLQVTLTADQPSVMLGEPAWLSFTVTNLSDEPLKILTGGDYENDFGRPASFTVTTTAANGRLVEQPQVGPNRGGIVDERDLPAGGSHVFRIFLPHWATLRSGGTYTVACRRTIEVLRPGPAGGLRVRAEVVAEERETVRVRPRNETEMRVLIATLGERMVAANGERHGDEAVITLAWIADPRVVPYFRRALDFRIYAFKFIAVQAMGRFSTNEAFEGLRAALATRPSDFDLSPARAAALAEMIRTLAAGALTKSRHPEARELLVTLRHDDAEPVRLMSLRALARLPAGRAVPMLEEMKSDRSPIVRAAAERYLEVLQGRG